MTEFTLTSEAFAHGGEIPRRHTCEGEDISPALSWSDPPAETRALALIVDDPDAPRGTFTHWVTWNIDPLARGLGEGESALPKGATTSGRPAGAVRALRPVTAHTAISSGCTPSDAEVDVGFRAGRRELERAIAGHVLTTAEFMGRYER